MLEHDAVVELEGGRVIRLTYDAMHGAEWRMGTLTIFAEQGTVSAREGRGLEHSWVTLQSRACALPELTVGLRGLGSRHGGDAVLQARFFAPLLAARRRLEDQQDPSWRLAAFDADELRDRTTQVLRELIAERCPPSPAARRSMEARAIDEAEGLHAALLALGAAADALRTGEDAARFGLWRTWASRARDVFVQADRCWLAVWPMLEAAPASAGKGLAGRRPPGGKAAGALALIAGAAYFGIR